MDLGTYRGLEQPKIHAKNEVDSS